jgi:hypothetical protein
MNELLSSFFEAAESVADLLDDPETAQRWDDASALEGLSIGELAAHLTQGVIYIDRLLDGPGVADAPVVGIGEYVASFKMESFDDEIHRYLRDKAVRSAAHGPERTTARFGEILAVLRARLPAESGERLLEMRPVLPWAITLQDRIRLVLWDLVVHLDDLAVSLGRPGREAPERASGIAIDAMLDAARSQHGDQAVIRALARRERSAQDVFPVV